MGGLGGDNAGLSTLRTKPVNGTLVPSRLHSAILPPRFTRISFAPTWHARAAEIRRLVERLPSPVIDRATIEEILGLRRRQAIRLMASLQGYKVGGHKVGCAYIVERAHLLSQLSELVGSRGVRREQHRKRQVLDVLSELQQEATARTTRIPRLAPVLHDLPDGDLPEGILLARPGEISIAFRSPEELLSRVLALSQAAVSDYPKFRRTLSRGQA